MNAKPIPEKHAARTGHKRIWLGAFCFIVLGGLMQVLRLHVNYSRTLERNEDRLTAQARVVDENLGAKLAIVNLLLSNIVKLAQAAPPPSRADINKYLAQQAALVPGIRTVVITDSYGRVVLSNREDIIGLDDGGRDYFRTARDAGAPGRRILTPAFRTVDGESAINISRALTNKRGVFRGVVSASLDQEYFMTLLKSVLYSPDNAVCLMHAGGEVFMSAPDACRPGGRSAAGLGALIERHREGGRRTSVRRSFVKSTGEDRLFVLVTNAPPDLLVGHPIVVVVSRDMNAVLGTWRRDLALHIVFYTLFVGVSVAITRALLRRRSERMRAEEEKARLQEQLVQAQKLEAIGILAGGIAHDFNNLLTSVVGFIDAARRSAEPGGAVSTHLMAARKNCEHSGELIRRLMTFATGGRPRRELARIGGLIAENVEALLRDTAVVSDIALPEGLHPVPVDQEHLRQVIANLAANAKEAMPNGGTLFVRGENVRIASGDEPRLPEGDYVKLTMRDTGCGIAPENLTKIFNPYYSTKETYNQKGLGLGLAVCHSVIKGHGGHITLDSQTGVGTAVTVYLPAFEHDRNDVSPL